MRLDLWIMALHVLANVVWVGALLAAVVMAGMEKEPENTRNRLGLAVYRRLAVPGMLGSLVFGAIRLGLDWRYLLVSTHFMHAKLLFVVVAIASHHLVGASLRRAAGGGRGSKLVPLSGLAFGLACAGAIILAVIKPL